MKKVLLIFAVLFGISTTAQKKKKTDIMLSKDIQEIETFLKTAHPEDPRRNILKSKVVSLKNSTWMKKSNSPMIAVKPIVTEPPKTETKQHENDETEEFKKLISETEIEHKEKTVKTLNQLFNEDPSNQEAILLIQNHSNCNMIMRIQGKEFYNLAIAAYGENSLVLKKGNYVLKSKVCSNTFHSEKNIKKNMIVTLNQAVLSAPSQNKSVQVSNNSTDSKIKSQK